VFTPDGYRPLGVPGVLDKLTRGAAGNDVGHEAGVEAEPRPVNGGPGVAEQLDGDLVAPHLDPDLGQDPVGVLLDQVETVLLEQVVVGDPPFELLDDV